MGWLKRAIVVRSASAELLFVVLVAFGILLVRQTRFLLVHTQGPALNPDRFIELIAIESAILLVVGWVLAIRGWTLRSLGITPTLGQTLLGPVFTLATLVIWAALALVVFSLVPDARRSQSQLVDKEIGIALLLAVSIVNGFFEELFLCGYMITVLKRSIGAPCAIGISVVIRVLHHVYQGPAGMLNIAGMGLLFAYWFARTGKLWPLIVGHILLDVITLLIAN